MVFEAASSSAAAWHACSWLIRPRGAFHRYQREADGGWGSFARDRCHRQYGGERRRSRRAGRWEHQGLRDQRPDRGPRLKP